MRGYRFCHSRAPPKALENDARRSPKATRKREKTLQKRLRNFTEKSCLEKPKNVAKRAPGGTPEAPKNRLKTDPEIHPSPLWPHNLAQGAPGLAFYAPDLPFYRFRLPFCVVFGRNLRPQKQLTRQAPKRKTSLRPSIYLRGFVN